MRPHLRVQGNRRVSGLDAGVNDWLAAPGLARAKSVITAGITEAPRFWRPPSLEPRPGEEDGEDEGVDTNDGQNGEDEKAVRVEEDDAVNPVVSCDSPFESSTTKMGSFGPVIVSTPSKRNDRLLVLIGSPYKGSLLNVSWNPPPVLGA